MKKYLLIVTLIFVLGACGTSTTTLAPSTRTPSITITSTTTASETRTVLPGETQILPLTPSSTVSPDAWRSLPVFPLSVSQRMMEVFKHGLGRGRDPSRLSKIGDCQNITPYFLAAFDSPSNYRLGNQYETLQSTIDHFSGSWSRKSIATHGGFNAATVMNPNWIIIPRSPECDKGETPSACELRFYNPSFAIISMEEAWSGDLSKYDHYLRMLVEFVLSQDVIPIIATRAELPDSSISINATVVQVAYDYQVPLWNFGAAAANLPNNGLSKDGFHLTPGTVEGNYYFDDPARMELGWTIRNLTALQSVDAVFHGVTK